MRGALAPLTLTDCEPCRGEGCHLVNQGQPSEKRLVCVSCGGDGTVEVCEACGEQPRVVKGIELCNCFAVAQTLGLAA